MPKLYPPNTGYKLDPVTGLPIESQYDPTKGNPTGDLPKCPRDGNQMIRIGSSSYDLRCPQCGIQGHFQNLRGMAKWPNDGGSSIAARSTPGISLQRDFLSRYNGTP